MEQEKKPKLTPVFTLLESAIKTWWKNLRKIIGVYIWGLFLAIIPLVIVLIFFGLAAWLDQNSATSLSFKIVLGVVTAVGILLAVYFSIRAYMGVFLLVKKDYQGQELEIFKETKKLFWPYLGLTILTTVLIFLWALLLIIPGIIYSIFYSFAVYAFFFEDKRGMAAIRRSFSLVKGYWWPVFGRLLVLGIVCWIFLMLISIPLGLSDDQSVFYQIWNIFIQVVNFLVGPIALLFSYQIYQDLVKLKK
ncbi:MAG: hypothetical protein WC523_02535 [Patescibacteria group bacterium]|jgi:hypothetical protein